MGNPSSIKIKIVDISRVQTFKDVSANGSNLTSTFVSPRIEYLNAKGEYRVAVNGMDFSGATLRGLVTDANTILMGANFTNADLRSSTLAAKLGLAKLVGANMIGADLTGVDLSNADLSGADLTSADLTGVDLSNTNITNVDLPL